MKLVLTCEHGGHFIPKEYAPLFIEHQKELNSHRGYDLGSLDLFKHLQPLADFSLSSETSRLLIELNRSLHHNNLFSEISKSVSKKKKEDLIDSFYLVYRNKIENQISELINAGETVLHISVHSFTPILNEEIRNCDIGLLYDSRRLSEKLFSKNFKENLNKENGKYRVRFNYPYLGIADGFPTYLRKQFQENYIGIELEINQKFSINNVMDSHLKKGIYSVLQTILQEN